MSSGTANMVTMSANAGAADRVLTSGGSNKTAKDSGVAIGDLAKKDLSNVELATLIDKGVGMLSVHEYTLSGDSISNLSSFMGGISADEQVYLAKDSGGNGLSPIIVVEDPSTGSVACMFVASNRRLYYVYADDDTGSYVSKSTFIGDAASTAVDGLMSAADKAKLDGIAAGANKYTLPAATASALGGVKSGEDVEVDSSGIITVHFAEKASEADCDENGDKIVDTYARFDELPVVATASKAGLVKSGGYGEQSKGSRHSLCCYQCSTCYFGRFLRYGDNCGKCCQCTKRFKWCLYTYHLLEGGGSNGRNGV